MSDGTSSQTFSYGMQLLMLLSDIENRAALDDPAGLCDFLTTLVGDVGMRVLDGPRAATEAGDPERAGHSAVVILYESHAAVHTYTARASLFLDIFSCKTFEPAQVVRACHNAFGGFVVSERQMLDRGAHWNGPADAHLRPWLSTRENVRLGSSTPDLG